MWRRGEETRGSMACLCRQRDEHTNRPTGAEGAAALLSAPREKVNMWD